jgi:DNA-binding Xre family transcriptional regulator
VAFVDLAKALASALRRMRQEADLTQAELAKSLGISRPTLTRLENGDQNVTLRTLTQLCRALNCEPGDLFRPGALNAPRRRHRET